MVVQLQPRRAERKQKKFKGCLQGVSGSGKTLSALYIAMGLAEGDASKILCVDTENGSAELYADEVEFKVFNPPNYRVETYVSIIEQAAKQGFKVLVLDSVTPLWEELLEEHDRQSAKERNSFAAWRKVTPIYKKLMAAIVAAGIHIIVTMRSKDDYVIEEDDKGKKAAKKVGLAPIFRSGAEYEFDLVATIDLDHNLIVQKTRLKFLADEVIPKPTAELGSRIRDWLAGGKEVEPIQLEATPAKTNGIAEIIYAFAEYGYDKKQLEEEMGFSLENITAGQKKQLRDFYKEMKDEHIRNIECAE